MDLPNREINLTRSYGYDSTKGNRDDRLPIPEPLVPFLEAAVAASPSELVFPNPHGEMYSRDTKLNVVVRRGLARAGVVLGYDHTCRRGGCGYRLRQQDPEPRWCPSCKMKLWPRPIPKKTRFHDLRHSTATFLLKEGVPMGVVQKILRHSDITITEGIYGHLDNEDVRKGLARMPVTGIEELANATPGYHPGRQAGRKFAAEFAANSPTEKVKAADFSENRPKISGLRWSGRQDLNLRPLGPEGPQGDPHGVAPGGTASQPFDNTGAADNAGSHTVAPVPPDATPFGALVVHGNLGALLTVREVAARLRVSRAIVYRLVRLGTLPALRISNAIRVTADTLGGMAILPRAPAGLTAERALRRSPRSPSQRADPRSTA